MIKKFASISVFLGVTMLLGCATPVTSLRPTDPAKMLIQQSILKAVQAPNHSANADTKATPAKMTGGQVTIRSYVGDASNLLSRVAKARGMNFLINGPEPRLPLLVTVDVESVGFEEFLSQVSFQFGQRADLVLGDNRIEIRYRGQP